MSADAVSAFAADRSPVIAKVIDRLERVSRAIRAYRSRRADIALLRSMDERELRDIGLSRCDIEFIDRR